MRMTTRLFLGCLLAAAALPAQQSLSPEDFAAAASWFDGLGYPAVAGRPFVRVATGHWTSTDNGPEQNTYVSGFLLADDGRRFRVLTIGLDERSYERSPKDTAEHERVGYTVEPLVERARQALAVARGEEGEMQLHLASSWLGPPAPSFGTSLFFLARTCAQLGEEDLGRELAAAVLEAFRERPGGGGTLCGHLARDLAHVSMWRLILAFDDRERPFADVLAECERFLQRFPDSEHAERAEATRAVLQRMVAEEQARAPLAADADEDARLAELVFQLRDQNGKQWSQPGACDVFADPRGEESPAHRLVAHGLRAVPFLLPAFDDDSFTRSVGFHRSFHFSHQVLRVRDVAAAVFGRITGTWVGSRAGAERTWRDLQQQGELAFLIAGAEGGNLAHAERLVSDHPEVALPALRKGLAAVAQSWQRSRLLEIVSGLPGEEAGEALREALGRDDPQAAVAAAVALFVRGERDAAVDGMIAAWQRGPEDIAARQVGGFLAVCGVERAVAALAGSPARLDDDVLRSLGNRQAWLPNVLPPDGSGHRRTLRDVEPEAGTDAAVERLLAALLDDERRFNGNYGGTIDPEIRDFAAQAMSERWPDRYAFDFAAPRLERQRQIRQAANAWRGRQGMAPLPGPARPQIPSADATTLAELFEKARVEPRPRRRRTVLDEIEALGLGALPTVTAHAAAVANPEREAEWQALASRIASHVRVVRLAADSAPFPADVEEKALALRGRRLDPGELADLLCTIGKGDARQPTTAGVNVTRADNGTGVVLEFAFGGGARGGDGSVGYWATVTAGRDGLCDVTGAGIRRVAGERSHYDDFARALGQALEAPPDLPVDARYAMEFR